MRILLAETSGVKNRGFARAGRLSDSDIVAAARMGWSSYVVPADELSMETAVTT
jgi:hypothetical protein